LLHCEKLEFGLCIALIGSSTLLGGDMVEIEGSVIDKWLGFFYYQIIVIHDLAKL